MNFQSQYFNLTLTGFSKSKIKLCGLLVLLITLLFACGGGGSGGEVGNEDGVVAEFENEDGSESEVGNEDGAEADSESNVQDVLAPTSEPSDIPDNAREDIFGGWINDCSAFYSNGEFAGYWVDTYTVNESTWSWSHNTYSIDDENCINALYGVTYDFKIETPGTATPATFIGEFFGNATDVNIIDTKKTEFGDVIYGDIGPSLGIWLVKGDRLFANINFNSNDSRPDWFFSSVSFIRE